MHLLGARDRSRRDRHARLIQTKDRPGVSALIRVALRGDRAGSRTIGARLDTFDNRDEPVQARIEPIESLVDPIEPRM